MSVQVPQGYKQTEVGVIPEDWRVTRLSTCLEEPPSYGINAPAVKYDLTLPAYIRITDISEDGKFIENNRASVSHPNYSSYLLNDGDLVFARTGASVGKSYLYNSNDGDLVYAGFLIKIKPNKKKLDSLFLSNYVKTDYYWSWVKTNSMRSGQPGINGSEYGSLPLALPPLKEQQAIAEALNDADALIESLEQLIVKKRQIKQGAMQELLTGQRRLPGFSGAWVKNRIGNFLNFQVGFPFSSDYFNNNGDGIRLIKNRDLKNDEQIFYYSGKYVDEFLVNDGDILVGMDGDFMPCRWLKGQALLNQRVGRISIKASIDSNFIYYSLIDSLKKIEDLTSATTVKHLSSKDIENINMLLPSLDEQTAIGTVLSKMDEEIQLIEFQLKKSREIKQSMMQELLTGRIRLI